MREQLLFWLDEEHSQVARPYLVQIQTFGSVMIFAFPPSVAVASNGATTDFVYPRDPTGCSANTNAFLEPAPQGKVTLASHVWPVPNSGSGVARVGSDGEALLHIFNVNENLNDMANDLVVLLT